MSDRQSGDGLLGFLAGIFLGGLVGGIVSVLLAPCQGRVSRRRLKRSLRGLPDIVMGEMEAESPTRQFLDRTRYDIEDRVERAKRARKASRLVDAREREEAALGADY